ncbi:MAG: hypothetical protein ACRYGP_31805 [Janthinobacterium lividum]
MNAITTVQDRAEEQDLAQTLAESSTVEGFMNRIFRKDQSDEPGLAKQPPFSSEINDFEKTSHLIESASNAIETLASRCEILQVELTQERGLSAEQAAQIDLLKTMVLDLKGQTASYESRQKSLDLRCQAADSRVAELEQHQKVVALRASQAESVSTRLQQQVEAAFGQGSPIRSVMDAVQFPKAAE